MKIPPENWPGTYGHRLGHTFTISEPGHTVVEVELTDAHCNPAGVCHGGALFTLADDAMGGAVHSLCPAGVVPTAVQSGVHYVRSVRPGERVRAEVHVLTHGKRTAMAEARVTDSQGRLVALLTGSFMFVEARYREPGE